MTIACDLLDRNGYQHRYNRCLIQITSVSQSISNTGYTCRQLDVDDAGIYTGISATNASVYTITAIWHAGYDVSLCNVYTRAFNRL